MAKKYFYITILLAFFFTLSGSAQESKQQSKIQESTSIEGLNLYPNPASNGKVYITSKNDSNKDIIIFDVLGKKVLQSTISSKELNISSLSPGVYIIKISEGDTSSATRKLIVR
ncbi:T9SS type A sorting domain-containing protein [Flavobacterium cellulosilyticum]|uniref:T9SS type A sorting domain-containing protein n=1 Tax=Flavobacterium cellulosilyticum TaxID=2541731 RepID=A0A4R5CKY4_9FLAO|nr:T9SS type A sorting domain-containing protein [Flavobacterium cellulosilyticum]TDD99876.1 T9SS type A sorting domain-containing protein [Flavobacterium cellulosilyticum]